MKQKTKIELIIMCGKLQKDKNTGILGIQENYHKCAKQIHSHTQTHTHTETHTHTHTLDCGRNEHNEHLKSHRPGALGILGKTGVAFRQVTTHWTSRLPCIEKYTSQIQIHKYVET